MSGPPPVSPFDRLRELALRIPEGAQELLPIIDFLETFPEQVTEEALVHLVGVTALGIAKAAQGGIWDGARWAFLRGAAPPFPTNPGRDWCSLPWTYGDELFGYLAVRAAEPPPALALLALDGLGHVQPYLTRRLAQGQGLWGCDGCRHRACRWWRR